VIPQLHKLLQKIIESRPLLHLVIAAEFFFATSRAATPDLLHVRVRRFAQKYSDNGLL
jgi:hypothetical protein